MPLRLDVKKLLLNHSDRVKSVDLHPSEPWVLTSLYSGKVVVRNYETQQIVKSFDASELPVRTAKFVPRKRWVICGADDMQVRVYNYNTSEKEKQFEAHTDYIRCIAVHPSSPLILTSSDDLTIKLWNWEKNWQQVKVFEGHSHYIMQVLFSPKDPNVFASCSLDATIRMWNINSSSPNFTLEGHSKGINCIDFYHGADKPHLVSGSDDCKVKVWDYQTKSCIQTLEAHTHNVTSVCFHPKLPVLVSGSEDQVVSIFNGNTYKLEETVNYGLERCWAMSYSTTDTKLALGYDAGTVVVKLGKEDPVISMDRKGKLLTANNNEISQISLKGLPEGVSDGEKMSFPAKEVATCDVYPEKIEYDPKGRFVSVTGDGEYIIYAAVSFKNKTYGSAEELVWGQESGTYAIREKSGGMKINKNFKQVKAFKKSFFIPQQIFGGNLLGVRSNDFICLYDWETLSLIRSIEVVPKQVYWNESGDYVALCCENSFYVLRYDEAVVRESLKSTQMTSSESLPEGEGITNCLELEEEIGEQVKDGQWIGDCFIYVSNANRLSYFIGGQTTVVAHLDKPYILIGYVEKYNRVYLMDYDRNIISYQLHISVIQYETAVVRGDLDTANEIFPRVPEEFHNQLARFLDNQGQKELALSVSKDPEHQFDLAIALGKLNQALSIVEQGIVDDQKWKQLGSIALHQGDFKLSEECMWKGRDFNGLLLLFTSLGNKEGLEKLAAETSKANKTNVAFTCYFYLQQVDKCIDLLLNSGRITEAAFFARTYAPSQVSRIVKLWRDDIKKVSEKASEALADPAEYPNLFPDFEFALQAEKKAVAEREQATSASRYPEFKDSNLRDLISLAKSSPEAVAETTSAPEAPATEETTQNGAEQVQQAEPAAEEAPAVQPEQPASETATKKKKKR